MRLTQREILLLRLYVTKSCQLSDLLNLFCPSDFQVAFVSKNYGCGGIGNDGCVEGGVDDIAGRNGSRDGRAVRIAFRSKV